MLPKSELEKLAKLVERVEPGSGVPDVEMVAPRIDVTFSPVAGDETLLGARDPRAPALVHKDMVAKSMAGIILVTTLEQRERTMKSTSEI